MKRKAIIEFISEIFIPFSVELYKASKVDDPETEDKIIYYPDCCKLASNILSTFLNLVTDAEFECSFSGAKYVHSWCFSNRMDLIIDVTGFQFDEDLWNNQSKLDKFHKTELSLQEVENEISNRTFIFSLSEYKVQREEYFTIEIHTIPDTPVKKRDYSFTVDSFFRFLTDNYETFIDNKMLTTY